jgi:ubiquinol-cytochrome c reductase cytochrome b subunit
VARAAEAVDDRFAAATPLRRAMNKVFPDHWTFLLGEIALYSLVILILTGVYLTFFFDPSMAEVRYDGPYAPLRGVEMSRAYESSLEITFEVRGGLFIRQMHHWAALLFMAAILAHMLRIFFTGAFRKPRELNWVVGMLLFWLGFAEGFAGYSLPDDALSGTGLRIAHAVIMSIPVGGTWIATGLFGGEFPGQEFIPRIYGVHVLLLPGAILALVAAHLGLVVRNKHTQFAGPGRTEHNVVGQRLVPRFATASTAYFFLVTAVLAVMAGIFQINPLWLFGPYHPAVVSAASQPDWYVWFLDGALRLFPPWEVDIFGHSIAPIFWAGVVLPGVLAVLAIAYPFLEARFTGDRKRHHLLDRPRDAPERTALGAMAFAFYLVLSLSATNDVIADKFKINLNATTWAGRIGLLIVPPLAFYLTRRLCLGLQQRDRERLAHGVETGIMRRDPSGRYYEIHQPLAPAPLTYAGASVPKKMNRLGALGPAIRGFFFPIELPAPPNGDDRPPPDEEAASARTEEPASAADPGSR